MSRRRSVLTLLPVFLLIGACEGSTKSAGPASSPTTTSSSHPVQAGAETSSTLASSGGAGERKSPSISGGSGSAPARANSSGGGSTNARVPATFVIGPGGRLTPPFVSSPAFLAVQLTVGSGDGRAHRVVLRAPALYSLSVPARGKAEVLIRGLRAGRYSLEVDGQTGGALMIGGEPGP